MSKRPIDVMRDAAFSSSIGDAEDSSPIREVVVVSGRMLIVKDRSIWQVKLPDDVDPDRTNPSIPHSQQKLLARGASDRLVGRTLLQAKQLLKPELLRANTSLALVASLEFLLDIVLLRARADSFATLAAKPSTNVNGSIDRRQGLNIPTVGDVAAFGKPFIQAADHSRRSLWKLIRSFDASLPPGVNFPKFQSELEAGDDRAKQLAETMRPFAVAFNFLRNTRNAIEHPKTGQEVVFSDFELRQDGCVYPPRIAVIEKDTPLSDTDLYEFFSWTIDLLMDAFEALLVGLCHLYAQPVGVHQTVIVKLEPNQRRYPNVAYAHATWFGEQLVPYAE